MESFRVKEEREYGLIYVALIGIGIIALPSRPWHEQAFYGALFLLVIGRLVIRGKLEAIIRCLIGLITMFWLLSSGASSAASVSKMNRLNCNFQLQGDIVDGDLERLKAAGISTGDTLCVDSFGGNYVVGLDIAEYFIQSFVKTAIDEGADCYSACAIIFIGGTAEQLEDIHVGGRKMHVTANLGFHAPYLLPIGGQYDALAVRAAYAAGLKSVSRMMTLGAPAQRDGYISNHVILELLKKGPDEAYMIDSVIKAYELRISLFGEPQASWNQRSACAACINRNAGYSRIDQCVNPRMAKIGDDAVQFLFDQFGAEGAATCAVRLLKQKDGRTAAEIAANVYSTDFPLKPAAFVTLNDIDALDPRRALGH